MNNTTKDLFLHIGMPKTATSAFQAWCFDNRNFLRAHNINYPDKIVSNIRKKHQFLISEIKTQNFSTLKHIIEKNDSKKMLLSTEGLTNNFYHFTYNQLESFRRAIAGFNINLIVVRRELEAWYASYYKQSVINPPVNRFPYATTLSLEEFKKLDHVIKLGALPNNKRVLKEAFGASRILVADFEDDWMKEIGEFLNIPSMSKKSLPRQHESVNDEILDIVLYINTYSKTISIRNTLLQALQKATGTNHNTMKRYLEYETDKDHVGEVEKCLRKLAQKNNLNIGILSSMRNIIHEG